MWQFLGLAVILVFVTLGQLFWPWPVYGYSPHLLLITGSLTLLYLPQIRYYLFLLLCALSFDVLLGEGLQTFIAMAAAAQVPLQFGGQKDIEKSALKTMGVCLLAIFIFELFMMLQNLLLSSAALYQFFSSLGTHLWLQLLTMILIRKPIQLFIDLLHYQRSEFESDILKGDLG